MPAAVAVWQEKRQRLSPVAQQRQGSHCRRAPAVAAVHTQKCAYKNERQIIVSKVNGRAACTQKPSVHCCINVGRTCRPHMRSLEILVVTKS